MAAGTSVRTPTSQAKPVEPATDPRTGLSEDEAARRRARYGANVLEHRRTSPVEQVLSFFWGPIAWMIEAAAIFAAIARRWDELGIILFMLLVNASVGFLEEHKADRAIEALKKRLAARARVLRGGSWRDISASGVVPGDVVAVRLGNIVPADLQLVGEGFLSVDQSALTGESLPVDKTRGDVAYSGSIVRTGEMRGVATAIGEKTFFGRTAKLVETAEKRSHFQHAILRIGNFLLLLTIGLVTLILAAALFRHEPFLDTLQFALILTVAAIPVALPAVLSVTMAVGATKLADMRAIVSRLVSIEEMAGMSVLCSDKTGTLTKNHLTLGDPVVFDAAGPEDVVSTAALTAEDQDRDAIDEAIVAAVPAGALDEMKVVHFHPFDPVRKRADAEVTGPAGTWHVSKGAPQAVLALVGADAALGKRVDQEVAALAGSGYRTIGVARDEGQGWKFLGLLSLFDPPRDDAAETIESARRMGLGIRMVTGDHVAIAKKTAAELHLGTNILVASQAFDEHGKARSPEIIRHADGFAEVFPEHKFAIVRELQKSGLIVGMTGDGVNDAPALKQATHTIVEERLSFDGVPARLYAPAGMPDAPGVVLVHGVHHEGIDEPRLERFARSVADAGVVVMTPEISDLRDYHVRARSIDTVGKATQVLRARLHKNRVGLMGMSFGGGLSLLAASDERFAGGIAFVVAVGAHDDLARVSRFFATDEIPEAGGGTKRLQAHGYGAMVLVYDQVEAFFSAADVPAAREALRLWLWERRGEARDAAKDLSPDAKRKMEVLFGDDLGPMRSEILAVIERRAGEMKGVSPHGRLDGIQANVYLLHGAGDTVIPASETMWLAADVPPARLRSALVTPALVHVELEQPTVAEKWALVHFMGQVIGEAEGTLE